MEKKSVKSIRTDKIYNIECQTYKKLKHLHIHKKKLQHKKYMEPISHQEAVLIFKARTRILNLTNKLRNMYEYFNCSCCSMGIDNKEHLLTKCENIKDIRRKYNINDYCYK